MSDDPEDKTEDASERRIEQALERGDVPRSADLSGFLALAAGVAATIVTLSAFGHGEMVELGRMLELAHLGRIDQRLMTEAARPAIVLLAAPLAAGMLGAVLAGMLLHRPAITFEPLMPKGSRISPGAGFKRLFGMDNLVQFIRSTVKLAMVSGVVFFILMSARGTLAQLTGLDLGAAIHISTGLALKMTATILLLYGAVAMADAAYQFRAWKKRLRMSLQEVKEEQKESDGNPEVRARLRSLRQQRARQRIMAAVPKATVVIVNPTHYAVALRYEKGMAAPVCVAKGVDELALRIRDTARDHRVPVVSNPPLARLLHASVKIDETIPTEHYKAIAEVIGFVLRARRGGQSAR